MVRPLRIEYPGALYHITDRGNERKAVFRDNIDRRRLIRYLAEAVEKFSLKIHAFCFMENHYHLEIETSRANLSQAMHWLKTAYTVSFNKRHGRHGHLFQGRYHAAVVEKESHLMALTRYIHLNPVRGGIVKRPEDYVWSSYRDYIRSVQEWEWLETGWTLDQFGGTKSTARNSYRRFVEEGIHESLLGPMEESAGSILLGSNRFVEWIQESILNFRTDPPAIEENRRIRRLTMERIIQAVSEMLGVSEKMIRAKWGQSNNARDISIYFAHKYCGVTNVRIGRELGGISGAHVGLILKKVKHRLDSDQEFSIFLRNLEENIRY